MAYNVVSLIGVNLTDIDTSPKVAQGTIVRGNDSSYGQGEFIYLKGVGSTAVGSVVIFDVNAGTTTLATAGSRGPVAVALAANTSTSAYAWYQIAGIAVAKAGTVAQYGKVYATGTPGTVDDAVVSGDQIDGAVFQTANGTPSAGLALVALARPSMHGQG